MQNQNHETFYQLRNDLLNKVLIVLVLVALPSTSLSLLRFSHAGFQPFMLTQISILLLLWIAVVGRQHLSYIWRIYALLFATWATSFSVIAYLDPLVDSKVFLTALPLFALLFLDKRTGKLSVLLIFITFTVLGWIASQYWLVFTVDYQIYVYHPLSWGLSIWIITVYSGIIAYVILSMMNYLQGRLKAVAKTEHVLSELSNNIPGSAIYRLQHLPSGESRFLYFSTAFAQSFGIDTQQAKGDSNAFYTKILADDLVVVKRLETISMRDFIPFDHVFRMYDKHGNLRWIHGRAMPQSQTDESVIWNGVLLDVSECKIAEQQRQASESRLQQIINSLPVGVAVINDQTDMLLLNHKFQQLFGYHLQDLPTLADWFEKACPNVDYRRKSLQKCQTDMQKAILKQCETPTREYQITAKNGREHPVEITLSPGKKEHVICFVDISSRRQVETSLHIYQQMVSSTKDLMAFLDKNLIYQKTNPAYAQFWGLSPQHIIGKSFKDILPPELAEQIAPRLESCLQGNTERFQQWRKFAVGLRFVDALYAPYRESSHEISGITVSIRDLTELQQAREALQHSEERLRSIIASINDLIFVQDAKGHYQDSYQEQDERLLLPLEEFLGKTHLDVLPEPLCQQWEHAIQQIKTEKTVQQFEYPLDLPYGQHWFSACMSGHYDAQGEFAGVISVVRDITQHKQLEASLQESETRYRTLFEVAGDLVFVHSVATSEKPQKLLEVNQVACDVLGYSKEELLNLDPVDVFSLNDVSTTSLDSQDIFEQSVFTAEGELIYLEFHARLFELKGEPLILSLAHDISHRKQAEAELKRLTDLLKSTQNLAHIGGWELDIETFEMQWTEEIYHIYELPQGFAQSLESSIEYYHVDDRPLLNTAFFQALEEGKGFDLECRLISAEGRQRWVRVLCKAIMHKHKVRRLHGSMQDISERKNYEQTLKQQERRLQFALKAAGAGTFYYDFHKDHNDWDNGSLEIFGLSQKNQDTRLEDWFKHVHEDDVLHLKQHLKQVIANQNDLFEHEYRILYTEKQVRHVRSAGYMVRNAKEAIGISGLHFDITEQKQAEFEIIRAREAAESASHAKSTFLANMSHELRTPLNAIMGYAQLLKNQFSFSEHQSHMISTIYLSGDYLLTLITDILDLAKIEAGRLDILPTSCHLAPFLQNLVDVFRMRAEQRNILFITKFAESLPSVIEIDEKRLRQILMNLLSNAVKFTEQGKVILIVDYQESHLLLSVKDTGIGIAPEQQENIFEPFQQFGDSHYKSEGTGLGLAICHKLIELMRGNLSINSQLGKGSEFCLRLPAPSSVQTAATQTMILPKPALLSYNSLNKAGILQILVVDDVSDNRNMLRSLLEPLGFGIQEVDSGEACLSLVQQWLPDLILLDLRMPGIDGLETVRRLRALPATQKTPIVMMSASVFEEDKLKTVEAGCNAYLTKPIQVEGLYNILQENLSLEWVYAREENTSHQQNTMINFKEKELSNNQAKELLKRVKSGNINHIKQFISELENSQCCVQLTTQLKDHAARFQLKEMKQLLNSFIEN